MKKLISVLLAVVMLFAVLTVFAGCFPREDELKILNWEDYVDSDIIDEFIDYIAETEDGRKIKVTYNTVSDNEDMYNNIKQGKRDYDLICPSDYMVARMINEDLLKTINFDNVPNASKTSPYITGLYDQFKKTDGTSLNLKNYIVGYTWGTMGILYNPKVIKSLNIPGYTTDAQIDELMTSWNALWGKDLNGNSLSQLNGKITAKNIMRDNFFVANTYIHKDAAQANNTTDANLTNVKTAWEALNSVSKYWESDEMKDDIYNENKNIALGLQWAGDAKYAIDTAAAAGVTLKYSVPKEGSNVFFDGWVVPKYAKNQELAEKFMDFMCDPDNAARNMETIGYSSVIITESFFDNAFIKDDANAELIDVSYFITGSNSGTPVMKSVSPVYYPKAETLFGNAARKGCYVMLDFGNRLGFVTDKWSTIRFTAA